jgi:hypothetical protein
MKAKGGVGITQAKNFRGKLMPFYINIMLGI